MSRIVENGLKWGLTFGAAAVLTMLAVAIVGCEFNHDVYLEYPVENDNSSEDPAGNVNGSTDIAGDPMRPTIDYADPELGDMADSPFIEPPADGPARPAPLPPEFAPNEPCADIECEDPVHDPIPNDLSPE